MLSIARQARRSCRPGAATAAAAAPSASSSSIPPPPPSSSLRSSAPALSFSTEVLRPGTSRRGTPFASSASSAPASASASGSSPLFFSTGARQPGTRRRGALLASHASYERLLPLSKTAAPSLQLLPPPQLLLCRSWAARAPDSGAPSTTDGADNNAAGLGNGGEILPLYADRLDRVYPRGMYDGQEEEGGGEEEEERGGWEGEGEEEWGGAESAVGARGEGEGGAVGSDFDAVAPVEEEDEAAAAAAAGEGSAALKDPSEMRLSRRIARSGIASRREAERLIEEGVVTVNGAEVRTPALNVGADDVVKVNGQSLGRQEEHTPKLWLVHKTRGELVTRQDPQGRQTIFDRLTKLKLPDTLMPVGRLDFNTEGLLLLTNDGDLARKMELPSSNIVRTYSVRVYGNITEEKLRAMRSGCTIDGVRYKGMFVRVEGGGGKGREGRNAWLTIECTEGKNRQIRKICKYLCLDVNRLARTRYGPFSLGKVRAGGVARLEIPEAFLRRLQEGTAGSTPGRGGGAGRSGGDRAGPGPGVVKRRQIGANSDAAPYAGGSRGTRGRGSDGGGAVGGGGGVGGSWGRGRGARIRKGVGAPMSRGDNASRGGVQRPR